MDILRLGVVENKCCVVIFIYNIIFYLLFDYNHIFFEFLRYIFVTSMCYFIFLRQFLQHIDVLIYQ